jgi:GNAT superfamily N-acetyltransferase
LSKPDDLHSFIQSIKALGINQWQNGYPHAEIIRSDISRGYSRAVELDGKTVATFAVICDGEPTYGKIYDGGWLTGDSKDYIAIHRVAILISCRGRGIAGKIIEYAASVARERNFRSIRIDTHRGNVVMRKMLEKNGFEYCGTIHLLDGQPRVAYEKLV